MLGYAAVIHLLQPALGNTHTLAAFTHTHTHLLDKRLSGAAEGGFGEGVRWASCAASRCKRQEEGNGKRKRGRLRVVPPSGEEKNLAMSKSTFLPPAQWRDYSQTAR